MAKTPDIDSLLQPKKKIKKKAVTKHLKPFQWKKGQSGNPKGAIISPEKRALKVLTERSLAECIKQVMTSNENEIQALIDDPDVTVGHKIILKAAQRAVEMGHYAAFDFILERAIGKVVHKVDMTSGGSPIGQSLEDKEKVKQVLKAIEDDI